MGLVCYVKQKELTLKKDIGVNYWNQYYKRDVCPKVHSKFAEFCLPYFKEGMLLDVGCGNGRDSYFFAENGLSVVAIDNSSIVNNLDRRPNLNFFEMDISSMINYSFDYIYARFLLHAITEKEENFLLWWIEDNLKKGGLFCSESRTINDEFYGKPSNHFRRFIDKDKLERKLKRRKFKILYSEKDIDFSPYKKENPSLLRLIVKK